MGCKTIRKYRGLDILELATASGVSPSTIVKLEGGVRVRSDAMARLAKALGCTVEDLDPWILPDGLEDDRLFRLLAEKWVDLDPEAKGRLIDLALREKAEPPPWKKQ